MFSQKKKSTGSSSLEKESFSKYKEVFGERSGADSFPLGIDPALVFHIENVEMEFPHWSYKKQIKEALNRHVGINDYP